MSLQIELQNRDGEDPRFPVGHFVPPARITEDERVYAVATLAELPTRMRNAVDDLDQEQLNTRYREGGWMVRQVVHHVADSHMNAVLRVRMALTVDWPTVMPYDEDAWARMHDYAGPVEWSLELIESLHARWVMLLQSLSEDQWQCGFNHPKLGRMTVEMATMLYAWHSRHHVAHIMHLRAREDW